MAEGSLILGIDLGTSSVKVSLLSRGDEPHVVSSQAKDFGSAPKLSFNSINSICQPNEHEQDVGKIFHCVHFLLSRMPQAQMARVTAIAVTGQMHGVIGWLGNNLAFNEEAKREKHKLETSAASGGCGNLITWLDHRCTKEFLDALPRPTCSEKPFAGDLINQC